MSDLSLQNHVSISEVNYNRLEEGNHKCAGRTKLLLLAEKLNRIYHMGIKKDLVEKIRWIFTHICREKSSTFLMIHSDPIYIV